MVILTAFYESDDAEQNNYGYYYNRYNNSCTHISCSLLGMLVFYLISIHYNVNVYELSEKCLRNINMKVFSVKLSDFFNTEIQFPIEVQELMKEAHKLLKMEAFEVYGGCGQESVVFQLIYGGARWRIFYTADIS